VQRMTNDKLPGLEPHEAWNTRNLRQPQYEINVFEVIGAPTLPDEKVASRNSTVYCVSSQTTPSL
jgi:hypothetical protein